MLVATCPSREELIDYAVGKLSDEAAESLASHLDSCENCQAELAALSDADDTLVARLRDPLLPDPILDEPECSRAVARARAIAENDASVTNLPRLLGEYQLLQRLGSGGMGTVYKALHTKLGRVVALKVLTRARTHDPAAVARFEREMQAVGQLDHRHIVRAHDAREIDGTPILVMEYLDGLDLGEIVRRIGRPIEARSASERAGDSHSLARRALIPFTGVSCNDAAELARQTAIGLQTIHEHGLVHRDIKPSNLMLTAEGEIKILDLGLARLRPDVPPGEEMTATGQGMGTADYMAPEQASDSRAVDIRADIYSLGCTLYKLLTGRAPFSGREYRTAFDKMTAHVHAAPPPVRDLAPAVPEGLATVLDRMLAKNPANRFSTPTEVADALLPYCTGANLAELQKRAASSPPLPPGEGRGEGGSDLPSTANRGTHGKQRDLPSPSGRGAGGDGRRWKRFVGHLVLLLFAGGLGFALAIILRIHKNGKDTTVELPDGSKAAVTADGQVEIELPDLAKGTGNGTTKPGTKEITQEAAVALVEDAFEHKLHDFTAHQTIEWGKVTREVNGNYSIRYKCEAMYHGKEKKILDLVFTFGPRGSVVALKDLNDAEPLQPPAVAPETSPAPYGSSKQSTNKNTEHEPERTWSPGGGEKIVGAFVGLDSGNVTLDVKGNPYSASFDKLSSADQEYVVKAMAARGIGVTMAPKTDRPPPAGSAPLPSVRVTQPVVCDVCDYEEYTGSIHEGHVEFAMPSPVMLAKTFVQEGAMIRAGDPLAEVVKTSDPKVAEALESVRTANSHRRGGRGAGPADPSQQGSVTDAAQRQNELKAAEESLESAVNAAPKSKVLAPISGRLVYLDTSSSSAELRGGGGRGGGGRAGTPRVFGSIELAIGPRAGRNRMHVSLCMIESTESMVLAFDVPERTVLEHRRIANRKPGWELSLPLVFGLADDKGFPYRGKIVLASEGIDAQNHTQRWEAIVSNKDGMFLPGMSVRVRVITSEPHKVMLIPPESRINALSLQGHGDAEVSIVNEKNIFETRKVKVKQPHYDRFIPVIEGLNANDWVVQRDETGRGGRGRAIRDGDTVSPEKVTTPPPPWALISVPPSVTVAHPVVREVTDFQDFTGHVEAAQTAEIRARASGELVKLCFKPGMSVKKGDVLFEIDPRLYQAELDQAAGGVKQAQIRLNARKLGFDRMSVLAKNKAVSQEEIDKARSQRDEAEAAVQTAEAALNVAKVRMEYTKITAPFDGRISRSLIDPGNLVTADKSVLATLASTDPMYVYFDIDERTALTLRRNLAPAASLSVSCGLTGEDGFPRHSTVDSAENRVDPATGTIRLRRASEQGRSPSARHVRPRAAGDGHHT